MYTVNCDWRRYYVNQAGSGLRIYKGAEGQAGYNIFSSFFRKYGIGLLKFLGRSAYEPLKESAREVFVNKADPKEAFKTGLKQAARNIAVGALDKAKEKVSQLGKGRRRKRRSTTTTTRRTIKRKTTTRKRTTRRKSPARRKSSISRKKVSFTQYPTGDVFGY